MIQGITIEANSVVVKGSDFDALCALARENEQLRGTLSLAEEGLANYAQENEKLCGDLTLAKRALEDSAQEKERLREALLDLCEMYAKTWDRVDGALVMMPETIPQFEKAHLDAQRALRRAPPQSAEQG